MAKLHARGRTTVVRLERIADSVGFPGCLTRYEAALMSDGATLAKGTRLNGSSHKVVYSSGWTLTRKPGTYVEAAHIDNWVRNHVQHLYAIKEDNR